MRDVFGKSFVIYHSGFAVTKLKRVLELVDNGFDISGVFVAYPAIMTGGEGQVQYLKELRKKDISIMIDSGAHGIIYYWLKKNGKTIEMGHNPAKWAKEIVDYNKYDWYVHKYMNFIKRNEGVFDFYVELDVQKILGYEKVWKWRQQWKKKGLNPMLVWHGETGEELENMVSYGDNIGIGGTDTETGDEMLNKRIKGAQYIRQIDKDIWIHWFAFTNWSALRYLMKYDLVNSVDSTSWTVGSRFGIVYVFDGHRILTTRIGESKRDTELVRQRNRARFRKHIESEKDWILKVGLDYEGMYNLENWRDMEFWNIHVFEEYGRMLWEKSKTQATENDIIDFVKNYGNGNGKPLSFPKKKVEKKKTVTLDKWFR